MEDERYEAIVRRVERVELDLRRWRRVATVLAVGAVGLATVAAGGTRGRVVEAQKFVVRDLAVASVRSSARATATGSSRCAFGI